MTDKEKVIKGLEEAFEVIAAHVPERYWGYSLNACKDAQTILEAQEQTSEQDRKDLDILRRVRDGKLAKVLCRDYVIYNGEWYRNHKWDWPEKEPLEPLIVNGEPVCGMCLYELRRYADIYCPWCGRKIKWK